MSCASDKTDGERSGELTAILDIEPAPTVGSSNDNDNSAATQEVINFYITRGVIEAGQIYGLREGVLTRRGPHVRIISKWPNTAAYQAWLDAPERASLIGEMAPLITNISGATVIGSSPQDNLGQDDIVMHRVGMVG